MKRGFIFIAAAPLLLGASCAWAAGINLGWNDCPGGATYALAAGILAMSENEIVIDMQTAGPTLSPWWMFGATECRPTSSLHGDFDFTAGPFSCYDYWQGGAIGGVGWSVPPNTTNRCRIMAACAFYAGDPRISSVPEGTHVYALKIVIDNEKSAGLGACSGCNDEACLVLQEIDILQAPPQPPQNRLTNPDVALHVVWQGWSSSDPYHQCPDVTPARTRSWGSIKALYR